MTYGEKALIAHEKSKGKIEIKSKLPVTNAEELSIAYTPGVAQPCLEISKNKEDAYRYTAKGNLVAVVTDGTAVLGLGNIGPEAAMPVMEGKSILFKAFANVDAFPICLDTTDTEEIIKTVKYLAPTFGGINLEDIGAPRCFEIEKRLQEELDIPVFHDDQHGTAIIVSAAVINALKIVGKPIETAKFVVNGCGAAGSATIKMLMNLGATDILAVDLPGILNTDMKGKIDDAKYHLAEITNKDHRSGGLKEALVGADVFIGVSAPNIVTADMVRSMNRDAVVFAMANPVPEIMPDVAKEGGARVVGTGRSDFPNQINNVAVFPGIFRGALDARAHKITEEMKVAAAYAIANVVTPEELNEDYILPGPFDKRVPLAVAEAVKSTWEKSGK